METPLDRVDLLLKKSEKTWADLARLLRYSEQRLTNWKGRGAIPRAELAEVAKALGVSIDYIATGNATPETAPGDEFVAIERVNINVSAGVTGFRVEHINGNGPPIFFRADWLASRGLKAAQLYALKVTGDSMEPNLWAGDLVVINSADTTPKDGEVFVANYEGEVIIKRLMRDSGEWWLTSDNQRHKPKRCDEHAELIGRVIYKQSERI
jgi:phage repressor protein C with HTH and peptisase S24 domain